MTSTSIDEETGRAHDDRCVDLNDWNTGVPGEGGDAADDEADEVTGASPGTAQACSDLGLNSLESNLARFGIKPPGVA